MRKLLLLTLALLGFLSLPVMAATPTYDSGTGQVLIHNHNPADISGTGNMTVDGTIYAAGNVGINTSVPTASLNVVKLGTTTPLKISSAAGGGGDYLLISTSGNVGIGSTSPSTKLDVNGNVRINGTLTSTSTDANYTLDDIYIDGNDNTTSGVMRLGGVGNTNNESIDLDFETTTDKVKVSSASNVYAFNQQFNNVGQSVTDVINASVGSSQIVISRSFADDTFVDDEEFIVPTGGAAYTTNATGFGSSGVDGFETGTWTNPNSDLQYAPGWTSTQLDNDGGTPGSPTGDYSERSTVDKYSGTYSWHFVTDSSAESVKINGYPVTTSGVWYRSQLWTKEVSGTLVTNFPNWSTAWNGNDNGCCRQSPPTGSWAFNGGDWYFPAGATLSIFGLPLSTGEAYFDNVSIERISAIEGIGEVWAGTEYAKFLVSNSSTVIEDGEDAWDEQVIANVTATADNTTYQVGAASAKFAVADGFTTGVVGSEAVTVDTSVYDAIQVKVRSSVDLAGGDYRILLDDTANCASPTATLNLPLMTANTDYTFLISLQGETSLPAPMISLGVRQNADKGAMNFWIDDVRLLKYGEVTLLDHTTNVANTDSDGNLCVYDKAGFITPAIKNRLGSTKSMTTILRYREVN